MDPEKGYWGCTPTPLNFEKERKQIKNRTKGNKKSMDHITHLRNISKQQTNWSKIYDYTTGWFKGAITCIYLENGCGLLFEQTCIHFTQGCFDSFCENWLKLAKWFWKKILKVFNVFLCVIQHSYKQIWIPSSQDAWCPVFFGFGEVPSMYFELFSCFAIISP